MNNNIDLSIMKDAFNYVKEATTDAEWFKRTGEIRKAHGGMLTPEWGGFPPMPSLVKHRPQHLVDQV